METKFLGFRASIDWFNHLDEIVWQCRTSRSNFIRQAIDHYIDFLRNDDEVSDLVTENDNEGGYPHVN